MKDVATEDEEADGASDETISDGAVEPALLLSYSLYSDTEGRRCGISTGSVTVVRTTSAAV